MTLLGTLKGGSPLNARASEAFLWVRPLGRRLAARRPSFGLAGKPKLYEVLACRLEPTSRLLELAKWAAIRRATLRALTLATPHCSTTSWRAGDGEEPSPRGGTS
jgi:hypothetical protein